MRTSISIEPFDQNDTPKLAAVWFEGWQSAGVNVEGAVTLAQLGARIPEEIGNGWAVSVAKLYEEIVGFSALKMEFRKLDQLFVIPSAQRCGIGKVLLDHAKSLSPGELILWTAVENIDACRFYEREGFIAGAQAIHEKLGHPIKSYRWRAGTL
ncbi:MAG: GNAT family N-acetyltransferase [Proteobacteria bacterium]|nr:GNAT family N-acetyltransferase [Pseudomonadota bacterium]